MQSQQDFAEALQSLITDFMQEYLDNTDLGDQLSDKIEEKVDSYFDNSSIVEDTVTNYIEDNIKFDSMIEDEVQHQFDELELDLDKNFKNDLTEAQEKIENLEETVQNLTQDLESLKSQLQELVNNKSQNTSFFKKWFGG